MPVIRDIPLSLKTRDMLLRRGLRRGVRIKPEIGILIQ
jgi:hypothetical protein